MQQLSPLELFAVFAAQLPLLTREDLEHGVRNMRSAPGWNRALSHAKLQADILGLDLRDGDDAIAREPPP
jgi:hypothetical protein